MHEALARQIRRSARPLPDGYDSQAWLADVLARIADHKITDLAALLPWNWRRPSRMDDAA